MALRWHVPLPGPFSVSGNVGPRISGRGRGILGLVIIAVFVIGCARYTVELVLAHWWMLAAFAGLVVVATIAGKMIERHEQRESARWVAQQAAAADATPEPTLGAEGDAFVKRSAQRLAEQCAAEPHGPGGTR